MCRRPGVVTRIESPQLDHTRQDARHLHVRWARAVSAEALATSRTEGPLTAAGLFSGVSHLGAPFNFLLETYRNVIYTVKTFVRRHLAMKAY